MNKKLVLGIEIGMTAVVLAPGLITVNAILGLGLGLQPAEAVDQDDESNEIAKQHRDDDTIFGPAFGCDPGGRSILGALNSQTKCIRED